MFKVTYFNPLTGARATLIDAIDEETAKAVIAKFGNPDNTFHYLPETKIEPMV